MERSPDKEVIRELGPADAAAFYALRLEALEVNPEAFSASAENWRARPLEEVRTRLEPSEDAFTLGAFYGAELVGMMGLFRERYPKLRHKASVWGVFVKPNWRGQSIAGRMLDALIARAREMPGLEQVQLGVVTANHAAIRLYESRGFTAFGVERQALRLNGVPYDFLHMQLFLREDERARAELR